jgi:hypothetical protein
VLVRLIARTWAPVTDICGSHARPPVMEWPTGGLPKHPAGYIYITLHRDVWFLFLTEGGGLVCFVTVCGVDVYAVERMTMCIGFLVCVLVSDMLM